MRVKKELIITIFVLTIFLVNIVYAEDVAYVLRYKRNAKAEILNVFSQLNLSVKLVEDLNIARENLAQYKLIFIDDAILRQTSKIPIYNYPSVIMNQNYGHDWGLTDADGISQLASTAPLNVKIEGNGIEQVYTQAKYSSGVSIPYYYLHDENKAPDLKSVARTYTGESNVLYNFGDVVAYASPGIILENGKTTKSRICFFGIAKTKYWTSDARELFKDCVGFVAVACEKNSDCNDNNEYTEDICENPGTIKAKCIHNPIKCRKNSDCGNDGFKGLSFCSGNNVTRNYTSFKCENPASTESYCTNSTEQRLNQSCQYACSSGQCIRCDENSDCNDNNNRTEDRCINPGTTNSTCENKEILCFNNRDCGQDSFIGLPFCSGKNISQDYLSFLCNNPGTSLSFCTNSTTTKTKETCSDVCINGECRTITCYNNSDCNDNDVWTEDLCINPGTYNSSCVHNPIACFNKNDCGLDYLSDNKCSGNNVVKEFINFSCNNPGASLSYCSNNSGNILNETCKQQCFAGKCLTINCSSDNDCNDGNARTLDKCINPGTTASYCRNTEVNCLNNEDCGFIGFVGLPFCWSNSIFKYHQTAICNNPGTLESNCIITISPKLNQSCNDNNEYTFDKCLENPTRCENLIIKCKEDSDCGQARIENNYCFDNGVWSNISLPICNNPANPESYCSVNYQQVLNKTCLYGCQDGKCKEGIHDVRVDKNYPNSVNGIKILNLSDSVIDGEIANLLRYNKYKFKVNINNSGNFIENISLTGNACGIPGSFSVINNLLPGKDAERSTRSPYVNITCAFGLYNITVNANLLTGIDANPLDNTATRQFRVVECSDNRDCSGGGNSSRYCLNKSVVEDKWDYVCINYGCQIRNDTQEIGICQYGCQNGFCIICTDNDNDSYNVEGNSCGLIDCDDSNARINPGAEEVCNNVDDNCVNGVDEDLTRACGSGICQGTQTCSAGIWGDCSTKDNDCGMCALCDVSGECAVYDEAQDTDCNDNLYCNGEEECSDLFSCSNPQDISCDDGVPCTLDLCNEAEDSCDNTPDNAICDNGLWCDGAETCDALLGCQNSIPIDCSTNDIFGIAQCFYNPDDITYTWDFRKAFNSECDEDEDKCTTGNEMITHTCDKEKCNAECETKSDCLATECDDKDSCYDGTYRDYKDRENFCESCLCSENECTLFNEIITDNDSDGFDTECDNDCDDNNANINPSAIEVCNQIDDDCDSLIDEDGVCECFKSCLIPNYDGALTAAIEKSNDNKNLQEMLNKAGYSINVLNQDNTQFWSLDNNHSKLEISFINRNSHHKNVFGYYTEEGFVSLGNLKKIKKKVVEVNGSWVGFAVENLNKNLIFYSENAKNSDGKIHSLVYNLCDNTYVLGFEDHDNFDYNDIVVQVKVLSC